MFRPVQKAEGLLQGSGSQRGIGGTGIQYTILVGGRQTYLFEDEDQWFVEAKDLHM